MPLVHRASEERAMSALPATDRCAVTRSTGARAPRADRMFSRVMMTLVALTILVVAVSALSDPEQPSPAGWTCIEVPGNGTLWDIASEHGVPGLSTAATIDLIQAENGLTSSTLHAGQTLVVPAISEASVAVAQR